MTDRTCRTCRFYLPEEADKGDCLSMQSGRVSTEASQSCRAHALRRAADDFSLDLPAERER
jgi:hypothetical protein